MWGRLVEYISHGARCQRLPARSATRDRGRGQSPALLPRRTASTLNPTPPRIPLHPPSRLQRPIRELHHQRGLESLLHGRIRFPTRPYAIQKIPHVHFGGVVERSLERDRRFLRLRLRKHGNELAAHIHPPQVPIETVKRIKPPCIPHSCIVDLEHSR